MKSLKRTLCLVLALVMVLGLFGIASATSFTDDNTIQYKEAVEVVTGIGAIKGYDNGTFNPKGTITRAEAAVMVARVALTNAIADDLKGVTSNFTDVTVEGGFSWAIPSIEYLVSKNIINGMGDGTFNPNGQISGYAVLKMLLCALGYGAKQEYTGTGWDLQVAVDANKYGLTAGRAEGTPALSASATREEVALYCFNALGTEMVQYSDLSNLYNPVKSTPHDYKGTGNATMADLVYGLKTEEGVVTENGTVSSVAAKNGTTTIMVDATTPKVFTLNTGLDLMGHYVKVYYKNSTVSGIDGTAYNVLDESTVVNVAAGFSSTGSDAKFRATFGSNATVDTTDGFEFTANFASKQTLTAGSATAPVAGTADQAVALAGTYIMHKNAIKAFIAPATYVVTAVTKYTAPTATAEGHLSLAGVGDIVIPRVGDTTSSTAVNYAAYNIYANPAEKDIVIVQTAGNTTASTQLTNVSKAAILGSGVVTDVDVTANKETLTAGGTKYTMSQVQKPVGAGGGDAFLYGPAPLAAWNKDLLGKTCAFYGDSNGQVVAVGVITGETESNLAYVVMNYPDQVSTAYGVPTYHHKIQCVTPDGKIVEYIVGVGNANNAATVGGTGTGLAGKVCKISTETNSDLKLDIATATPVSAGGAKESAVSVPVTGDGDAATNGHAIALTDKTIAAGNYFDASTQFIFVKRAAAVGGHPATETKILSGVQAVTTKMPYAYYSTKAETDLSYSVKYVFVESEPATGEAVGIVYVPGATLSNDVTRSYTKADGKVGKATVNKVYKDGEPYELLMDAGTDATTIENGFYSCTVNAQGVCTLSSSLPTGVTAHVPTAGTATTYHFVSNVYSGDGKTYATMSTFATGAYTTVAGLADVTANNVKVVDPVYDGATDKTGMTNHNTLASVVDQSVAYVYSTTGTGEKVLSAIYYVDNGGNKGRISLNLGTIDPANFILHKDNAAWATAAGTEGKVTATVTGVASADASGIQYTWTITKTVGDTVTGPETVTAKTAPLTLTVGAADDLDGCVLKTKEACTLTITCTASCSGYISSATQSVTVNVTVATA